MGIRLAMIMEGFYTDPIPGLIGRWGLVARSGQPQRVAGCDQPEIPIFGEQVVMMTDAQLGDQAIDRGANGIAFGTTASVDGGSFEVVDAIRLWRPVEGVQNIRDAFRFSVVFQAEQNFSDHDATEQDGFVISD